MTDKDLVFNTPEQVEAYERDLKLASECHDDEEAYCEDCDSPAAYVCHDCGIPLCGQCNVSHEDRHEQEKRRLEEEAEA